jgi:hypothetical protein
MNKGSKRWLPSSHLTGYMEATESLKYPYLTTRDTSPSSSIGRMPGNRNLLSLDARVGIPTSVLRFEDFRLHCRTPVRPVLLTGQTGNHQSDRSDPRVRPVWRCCCSTVFGSSVLALWINQGTQWFSGEPLETPQTRCSLHQSPLMTRLPRSPGTTLVLGLYQGTVHDFILLFMLPCGPHLTPLATGSLGRSLLVFSTPGGLTGDNLSRLFFTCTNTSKAGTCTCNT